MTKHATGAPGSSPRWTSTAKSGIGTALWNSSLVWFTLSHGILNEVYFPSVDVACIRDIGLIVTDGVALFSEEKRDAVSTVTSDADGVPAYRLVNRCRRGRYEIHKRVVSDPRRNVLLQHIRFVPLGPDAASYRLYLLLAPHIGNSGSDNYAWVGEYRGVPMLFACRADITLALACSAPWKSASVGFVGASDGWQDLHRHKRLTWGFDQADNGNVALTGEIDADAARDGVVVAVGFGASVEEAGLRVQQSFLDGFETAHHIYVTGWEQLQASLVPLDRLAPRPGDLYRTSVAMLRMHEDKRFPGGMVPSLSIPWGFEKGSTNLGDYHVVWPRDLALAGGALVAAGARAEALRVLHYLFATQEADGHWAQSMTIDGRPLWNSPQMDEPALAILYVDLLMREGLLDGGDDVDRLWPMVRRAAGFIVRSGPVLQGDRTDRDPGFSPYTLAAEVAALLVAADLAERHHEPEVARYLRETADIWNEGTDIWTWVTGTDLARWVGVEGYYVRFAQAAERPFSTPRPGLDAARARGRAEEAVTPDALALVRFGLRAADDPRILDTLRVIDDVLKVDTPYGASWHRCSDDRYGEHDDGSAFDGSGVGRAWPLLTGERAHYELAAGRPDAAEALMTAMEAFAPHGLIPEQVWDADDVSDSGLAFGRPTGSAMPLAWAHAEYIKLRRSLHEGRVFDMPSQTVERYQHRKVRDGRVAWRFNLTLSRIPSGHPIRIETLAPAEVHSSVDGWNTRRISSTTDTGLGIHWVDLPALEGQQVMEFTFFWPAAERWEERRFSIRAD